MRGRTLFAIRKAKRATAVPCVQTSTSCSEARSIKSHIVSTSPEHSLPTEQVSPTTEEPLGNCSLSGMQGDPSVSSGELDTTSPEHSVPTEQVSPTTEEPLGNCLTALTTEDPTVSSVHLSQPDCLLPHGESIVSEDSALCETTPTKGTLDDSLETTPSRGAPSQEFKQEEDAWMADIDIALFSSDPIVEDPAPGLQLVPNAHSTPTYLSCPDDASVGTESSDDSSDEASADSSADSSA